MVKKLLLLCALVSAGTYMCAADMSTPLRIPCSEVPGAPVKKKLSFEDCVETFNNAEDGLPKRYAAHQIIAAYRRAQRDGEGENISPDAFQAAQDYLNANLLVAGQLVF